MTWAALAQRLQAAPHAGDPELLADVAEVIGLAPEDPARLGLFTDVMTAWRVKDKLMPRMGWSARIDEKGGWAKVGSQEARSKAGAGAALLAALFLGLAEAFP
jgi:hypothetical protein